MSGGSMNYLSTEILTELFGPCGGINDPEVRRNIMSQNRMRDLELTELIIDICKLLHSLEWEESGDAMDYDHDRMMFKRKWLGGSLNAKVGRRKKIIDDAVERCRRELYSTFLEGQDDEG